MSVRDELDERVSRASLKELGDIRIDDVLAFIDRGIESMPSYLDLYRRWETQQWAVADLDFGPDKEYWAALTPEQMPFRLWTLRLFFNGEERVTATLAPFVWAAPRPEIEIFLATQLVDEARHTIFFERYWREVLGSSAADLAGLLEDVRLKVSAGYDELFYERLPGVAQRLASNPKDIEALVEGVTTYHLVAEGARALTGQRFTLEWMRKQGQTESGFYRGFTAVARDESRHLNFGIRFLHDMVREDPGRFAPLIQKTLVECLPLISGVTNPPDADDRYYTDFGYTQDEVLAYATASLNRRLQASGLNLAA